MEPRDYLEMLHVANRLKDTTRHCVTSNGRPESVAEHSFRISLMAYWLKDEFPECDIDRVIKMCLIHDLGECFTGDIPVFKKTEDDRKKEDRLLNEWVQNLPENILKDMSALYEEMNALNTKEAKLYKALDKLEALISHNEAPISSWEDHEYDLQRQYAWESVEFSQWLKELRKEILNDTEEKIKNS